MYASDLRHQSPSLEDKLNRLYALNRNKTIDLSFRPVYLDLLEKLGQPHLKLPPVIHVAGTNGKGSTLATLKSILQASSYKVHAYTSPHLINFNERIVLAGNAISDTMLQDLIDEVTALNKGREITFFEITTALAFAAFSRAPADFLLLETGLGGRLDCTNVIENPLLTIITSVGIDHTEHLGETLKKIAAEKAGIIKENVPCIIGMQRYEEVVPVFEQHARKKNALLLRFGYEWRAKNESSHLIFTYQGEDKVFPLPNLLGPHQLYNAGAALAALEMIKNNFPLSAAAVETGLRTIHWPARLQNITPLFTLPAGWEIWLDGGHNEDAAHALATQAALWRANDGKKLHLIMAMLRSRKPEDFATPLRDSLQSLHAVGLTHEPKAFSGDEISARLAPITDNRHAWPDYKQALEAIIQTHNGEPGRILIAGSLYLAGDVLKNIHASAHNG